MAYRAIMGFWLGLALAALALALMDAYCDIAGRIADLELLASRAGTAPNLDKADKSDE